MEQGYRKILKRIKNEAPAVRVYVQSLLPTRGNFAARNPDVKDFNARLRALAEEYGHDYIDLHSLMVDDKGELKSDFTADGLHLNSAAYKVWQAEIERVLEW